MSFPPYYEMRSAADLQRHKDIPRGPSFWNFNGHVLCLPGFGTAAGANNCVNTFKANEKTRKPGFLDLSCVILHYTMSWQGLFKD